MPIEYLNPTHLMLDPGLQIRVEMNVAQRQAYKEHLVAGGELPPVIAFRDQLNYWLADGWHRHGAHLDAGREVIPVDVRSGGRREAWLYALGANAENGLPRSQADKRRAVLAALGDPALGLESDRRIAEVCKVSHPFVGKVRAELRGENALRASAPEGQGDVPELAPVDYDPFEGVKDPERRYERMRGQRDPIMFELMMAACPELDTIVDKWSNKERKRHPHEWPLSQLSQLRVIVRRKLQAELAPFLSKDHMRGEQEAAIDQSERLADRPPPNLGELANLKSVKQKKQVLGLLARKGLEREDRRNLLILLDLMERQKYLTASAFQVLPEDWAWRQEKLAQLEQAQKQAPQKSKSLEEIAAEEAHRLRRLTPEQLDRQLLQVSSVEVLLSLVGHYTFRESPHQWREIFWSLWQHKAQELGVALKTCKAITCNSVGACLVPMYNSVELHCPCCLKTAESTQKQFDGALSIVSARLRRGDLNWGDLPLDPGLRQLLQAVDDWHESGEWPADFGPRLEDLNRAIGNWAHDGRPGLTRTPELVIAPVIDDQHDEEPVNGAEDTDNNTSNVVAAK